MGDQIGGVGRALFWSDPAHLGLLSSWLDSTAAVPFESIDSLRPDTNTVLSNMLARGWHVYEVDVSLDGLSACGFEAKRVLCPELLPAYCYERARPIRLGRYGPTQSEASMPPHPFA